MFEEERAARQQLRYKRRNVARRSVFAKLDAASEWVRNDPYLAVVGPLSCSITTVETAVKRRRRLDGELPKIGEEWSLRAWLVPLVHLARIALRSLVGAG